MDDVGRTFFKNQIQILEQGLRYYATETIYIGDKPPIIWDKGTIAKHSLNQANELNEAFDELEKEFINLDAKEILDKIKQLKDT